MESKSMTVICNKTNCEYHGNELLCGCGVPHSQTIHCEYTHKAYGEICNCPKVGCQPVANANTENGKPS